MINQKIIDNFYLYDKFLSLLNPREKEIALSLKMMYSIHMENNNGEGNLFFIKQFLRFVIKFFFIPFMKIELESSSKDVVLKNSTIEISIVNHSTLSLGSLKRKICINFSSLKIYKELFTILSIYRKDKTLNQRYILLLIHRLIDYLLVYHTINIQKVRTLLMENDRDPYNLALIHRAKIMNIETIKYDNWLIDPVNHNDVYCEYYFYPSLYHKNIIASFYSNSKLKYLKGGFFDWDRLNSYTVMAKKRVIYFTQFGIDMNQHKQYICDIANILKNIDHEYQLVIKIHPREESSQYRKIVGDIYPVTFISTCDDIYQLISESEFCFSVFSTISLEAKHIVANSYFINYDSPNFEIIDYDKLDIDLIQNREMLQKILEKQYTPLSIEEFIKKNNCSFPHTIEIMEKILADDN
jgi:hypothetical protein